MTTTIEPTQEVVSETTEFVEEAVLSESIAEETNVVDASALFGKQNVDTNVTEDDVVQFILDRTPISADVINPVDAAFNILIEKGIITNDEVTAKREQMAKELIANAEAEIREKFTADPSFKEAMEEAVIASRIGGCTCGACEAEATLVNEREQLQETADNEVPSEE